MGWVKDNFLGGNEKKAAQQQVAATEKAAGQTQQYYNQARNDIMSIFPQAYQGLGQAYQNAADIIASGRGSSMSVLQQAFNNANQTLQGGNQQAIDAILGNSSMPQQTFQQPQPAGLRQGAGMFAGGVQNQAMPVLRSDYTSVAGKGNVFEAGGQPVDMRASGGQTVPMLGGQPIINQPQVGMAQAQQSSAMQPVSTQVQPLTPATIGQAQQVQPAQQMQGGLRQGLGLLDQGYDRVQTAVGQGVNALQQGQDQSITALDQAQAQGLGRIDQSTGQAIDYLNPYADVGKSAINQEAALAGALGAEAQQQAINQFMESPAQQYNREQQEKALLRNATATGFGLRSGATLTELQKQASGISAQQQQQQLENIRNLAGRGQQAATTQGGYAQQGGVAGANLIGQIAGQKANVYGNQSGQIANMYGQQGAAGANLSSQGAGMANQAGQAIANQIGQTTGQLAGNQLNLGQLLAGLDQTTASNLSNLLTQGATQGSQTQMQLAQLLANLATGQGSQLANLTVGAGNAQAAGTVAGGGALRETVGTALGFLSDRNLKDNITLLVKGAVDLYSWTWKAIDSIPAHMHGALAIGVIAQDVEKSHPEAVSVSESGYLMVDYNKLSEAL